MNEDFSIAIDRFLNHKVMVMGDIMLDHYTFGEISHISSEAPVLVVKKSKDDFFLGGAANVANNLVTLGAEVSLCGFVGSDWRRDTILKLLNEKGIRNQAVFVSKRPTTLKHRLVIGKHQVLRLDDESTENFGPEEEQKLISAVEFEIKNCDAVILSDYNKGLFSPVLTQAVIRLAGANQKRIIADVKPKNKEFFRGVDVITPNLKEGKEMTGANDVLGIGKKLLDDFGADVVLTLGEKGIHTFEKNGVAEHLPAMKADVFDITGAGDTVVAALTLSLLSQLSLVKAAKLANYAGGVVVQKYGTATLSLEELKSTLNSRHVMEVGEI